MMIHFWLNEDRLPSKLPVIFSSKISKEIETIEDCNQNNIEAISQWHDYIDGIENYISNPVIAWDNMDRYPRFPNGARFIRDLDYNVGYTIKTNSTTNQSYVYVFMVNLKPEEFGLKVLSSANESIQRMETIRKAVLPILEFNQRLSAIR